MELENFERFHVKGMKNWYRCVLIFLRVSTVAFKLIILLPSALQNQFGVGYWAISHCIYCKLIEGCF